MSRPTTPLSPLSIGGGRRLSSRRRGSISAPDPFGKLPDHERGMSSTLTILRAPPSNTNQEAEERAKRRSHVRSHSGGSPAGRISFAFTAFSPQKDTGSGPRSASAEPTWPASPLSPRAMPRSNSFTAMPPVHTSLTPAQVYEVAQQCSYPQSQSPTPGGDVVATPVSFTPLPDTFYLPFLDRPSEVEALMSTPPTSRLFSLLAQAFSTSTSPKTDDDPDPTSWSYAQLERWLTKVGRDEADDAEWVQKARTCISTRSELIWERVKGALGVPPELDPYDAMEIPTGPEPDTSAREGTPADGMEDIDDSFGEAWLEPIVAGSAGSSPLPHSRSPTSMTFRRSPSLGRQSVSRMENISEDMPVPPSRSESPPVVHGLRVVTAPLEPPARRFSSPSPTSAGSFSHPHVPYDMVGERGPGHPLFPTSFATLALGPTLSANNPSLRSPTVPPASAYPLAHSMSRHRRKVPSWAEGFDLQKQEYAVSVASSGSRRSVAVE